QHGRYHELVGSREQAPLDAQSLPRLVPDLAERDVFVCGPEGFVTETADLVRRLGLPEDAIHHEAFAL
ncbi:MAG TPA: ferric reductase, partial [Streptosporangiaceae bacterium]